jgi:hypothetical protein
MIRLAVATDREEIYTILREYCEESPLRAHKNIKEDSAKAIVTEIILNRQGIILLHENEQLEITGLLIAAFVPNLWDRTIHSLSELAYFVRKPYRGSSAGYRLLKQYQQIGDMMKQKGEIEYYTISRMVNSPELKYERFGFEPLEDTWIKQ